MTYTSSFTAGDITMTVSFDPYFRLPPEVMLLIMSYLDAKRLTRASMVSRTWQGLCRSPELWQDLCFRADKTLRSCGRPTNINWHSFYQSRSRLDDNWRRGRFVTFQLPHRDHLFEGHENTVIAIQIYGDYLVSGGLDRTIRIWHLRTHRLIGEPLRRHDSEVLCLQFSPRSTEDIIISGSTSAELIVWKFSTATVITRLDRIHLGAVVSIKFNEKYVITSSRDRTIKVWDFTMLCTKGGVQATAIQPLHILHGHEGAVNSVDLLGDIVVSGSGDHTVKIWNVSEGLCLKTVEEPRSVACVGFDGHALVCGGTDRSVAMYDSRLQNLKECFGGHKDIVRTVRARTTWGSTQVVTSGSYDGMVIVRTRRGHESWHSRKLSPETRAKHRDRSGQTKAPWVYRIDFDARRLACCTQLSTIQVWDFANDDAAIIQNVVAGTSIAGISIAH